MRTLMVYESLDGTRWDVASEAEEYDRLIGSVRDAMLPLGFVRPKYNEFVRHNPTTVRAVRDALYALIPVDANASIGYVLRCKLDGAKFFAPVERALFRILCIDETGREWEQPYYVAHPDPNARDVTQPNNSTVPDTNDPLPSTPDRES